VNLARAVTRGLQHTDATSWCAVDLTMPQLKTLFLARTPGGMSHSDIARALHVGLSTVTGIVDRLVEHGLVERRTDPEDRRLIHVAITATGNELVDRLWANRQEHLEQVLAMLTPEERNTLKLALQHLLTLLGENNA
jgi:DNA-binding MarR family transcriptional regulator